MVEFLFYFERNNDVLKSKSSCFLLNKNVNFNKNKMENLTHICRGTKLVFHFIQELQIKNKTDELELA